MGWIPFETDIMKCKNCEADKDPHEFYANDKSCKECRKMKVRKNREEKIEYYREYDRKRANRPDRVAARNMYQKTPNGIASGNKAKKKWSERNAKKRWVTNCVNNAVRDGKLLKPDRCFSCGSSGVRIEGHHCDYDRPLDVLWLCSPCHRRWHKENGEGLNAS